MKLGLITDIHEDVACLRVALARFQSERVDQIVVIGDVFRTGEHIHETCRLLTEARVIGVWGNHDFGLSYNPAADSRAKYSQTVIEFMTSLKPRLEVAGCLFSHIEPWLDPNELADLWYFDGAPTSQYQLNRIFSGAPHRIMFAGHYHQWLLTTPQAVETWKGECPRLLDEGRYFVVLGALCEGRFAIFDTATSLLTPLTCDR